MQLAPIGIASLIIQVVFEIEDLGESAKRVGMFALVCVLFQILFALLIPTAIFAIVTRPNKPLHSLVYFCYFLQPALIAFVTTSAYVSIQKSIEICETRLKMDPRITRFYISFFNVLEVFELN